VERLNGLHWLANSFVFPNKAGSIEIPKLADREHWFSYCGELLQYEVLQSIQTFQGGSINRFQEGISKVTKATVINPYRLSKTANYSGTVLLATVAPNRFSKNSQQQLWWEHSRIPLPPDTKIGLLHNDAVADRPESFVVRLNKPLYFEIDFLIQPIAYADKGYLPPNVTLRPEVADHGRTYQMHVIMNARFEKITAGNRDTEEYKAWAQWLFDSMKERFSAE
jgi:hypothetical protein